MAREHISERAARWVVRRRWWIIAAAAAATGVSLALTAKLQVESSLAALFPADDPVIRDVQYVMENFGGDFLVAVVRQTGAAERTTEPLRQRLQELPEIRSVDLAPLSILSPERPAGEHGIHAVLLAKPVKPPTDGEFCRSLAARVKELGLPVELTGAYVIIPEHQARVSRDMRLSSVVAFVAVVGIVGFYFFGQWRRVALVAASLFAGLTWTLAVVYLAQGQLNLVTAVFPAMLLGIGVDYAIHVLSFFGEVEGADGPAWAPVSQLYRRLAKPLAVCACSTGVALFALTCADLRGFRDMGFMGGVGVAMELASALVLLPALLSTRMGRGVASRDERPPVLVRAAIAATGRPRTVLATLAVLLLVLGWFACQIGYETDTRQMQDPTQPSIRLQDEMIRELGLSFYALVAVVDARRGERMASDRALVRYCRERFVGAGRAFRYVDSLSTRWDSNLPIPRLSAFVGKDRKLAAYLFPAGHVYDEQTLGGQAPEEVVAHQPHHKEIG